MKILMISTADWDHPFWTNKQHVAMTLGRLGHEVLYVESLGIRPFSRDSVHDTGRILRRLRRFARPPRRINESLSVASPLVLPVWSRPSVVVLNRLLLTFQMVLWRLAWGRWDLVWTYSPLTTAAVPLGNIPVLYHCVDNIAAQPQMPADAIDKYESQLAKRAQVVFTTAPELTSRMTDLGATDVLEHTNVVDFEHFAASSDVQPDPGNGRKSLGFVGALSRYKVDINLVARLAHEFPQCDIKLIGQVGEGQPGDSLEELETIGNIQILGPRPYDQLPELMRGFDVALLPVPINEYTKSMFPMKFFEYLAAGTIVVSTNIPSLRNFGEFALISSTSDEFIDNVGDALQNGTKFIEAGRRLASNFTYRKRTMHMLDALQQRLVGDRLGTTTTVR